MKQKIHQCGALILMSLIAFSLMLSLAVNSQAETKILTPMKPATILKTKKFTINGFSAYNYAKSRGFTFSAFPKDVTSICEIEPNSHSGYLSTSAKATIMTGSKCDFVLFSGKYLNAGWKYVRSNISGLGCQGGTQPKMGFTAKKPTQGSNRIPFELHQWIVAQGGERFGGSCNYQILTLTLEGPVTAQWQDAFK